MSLIKIEVIQGTPRRSIFRELMRRNVMPDYVLFSFDKGILDSEIFIRSKKVLDNGTIILLTDDNFISWNNVAIPQKLFYTMSILHLRNYLKGIAHYLTVQNEYKIVRSKLIEDVGTTDINPYMITLFNEFYSNIEVI